MAEGTSRGVVVAVTFLGAVGMEISEDGASQGGEGARPGVVETSPQGDGETLLPEDGETSHQGVEVTSPPEVGETSRLGGVVTSLPGDVVTLLPEVVVTPVVPRAGEWVVDPRPVPCGADPRCGEMHQRGAHQGVGSWVPWADLLPRGVAGMGPLRLLPPMQTLTTTMEVLPTMETMVAMTMATALRQLVEAPTRTPTQHHLQT